ncbi:hypothetical protein HZ326_4000 [Fusarium oxysporum f. sp. albedinis]|nr:hypothetical protein HZ326_4000 [Fusarium oxysporum f. sp. albedinis]
MILTIKLHLENVFNSSQVVWSVHDRIAVTLPRNSPWRISSLGISRNALNHGREIPESRGLLYVTLSIPVFELFSSRACYKQDRPLAEVEMKEVFHRQSDIGGKFAMKLSTTFGSFVQNSNHIKPGDSL